MANHHPEKHKLKTMRALSTNEEVSKNRATVIIDTPAEVAAAKAQKNDPIDTPEEIQEQEENRRTFGPG